MRINKNYTIYNTYINFIFYTKRQQLNERLFLAELKSVLPNVKDWEGGRKSRECGRQEQDENDEE